MLYKWIGEKAQITNNARDFYCGNNFLKEKVNNLMAKIREFWSTQ